MKLVHSMTYGEASFVGKVDDSIEDKTMSLEHPA